MGVDTQPPLSENVFLSIWWSSLVSSRQGPTRIKTILGYFHSLITQRCAQELELKAEP